MNAPTHCVLADLTVEAASMLFGMSELAQKVRAATEAMRNDCTQLETNRGLKALSIGLLGPKNHGKSALARLLVSGAAERERIQSGLLRGNATRKLLWLGAAAPVSLDTAHEEFLRAELEDIGRPFVLIDVPGFSDEDAGARQCAKDALSSCQLKALIVERSQLEAEDIQLHLALADGATVLPFVRIKLPPGETEADKEAMGDIQRFLASLRAAAPLANILPVTVLPDFDTFGPGGEDVSRQRVIAALRLAAENVDSPQALVAAQIESRIHRWRRELRELLKEARHRLEPTLATLAEEERQLPERVLSGFIGSSELLEAGARIRLRCALMAQLSPIYFPFRPLVALLAFTGGAWDRLIIAMAGSVPSLALVFFTVARNVRDLRRMRSEASDGLERRVLATLRECIQPAVHDFWRAVQAMASKADTSAAPPSVAAPNVRLSGLAELQQASAQWFDEAIADCKAKASGLRLFAFVGTAVFWACMAGPLVSLYRQFFTAEEGAFGAAASTWTAFPVPSGSMLLTSLLLSLIPMLIIGLICVNWAVTASRTELCAKRIRERHESEIKAQREDGRLRLEIGDAAMEAARFLISL